MKPIQSKCTLMGKGCWTKKKKSHRENFLQLLKVLKMISNGGTSCGVFCKSGWWCLNFFSHAVGTILPFAKSVVNIKLEELCQISPERKAWETLPNEFWTQNTWETLPNESWTKSSKKLSKMSPEQKLERNFAKWVLNMKSLRNFAKTSPEQKLEKFAK